MRLQLEELPLGGSLHLGNLLGQLLGLLFVFEAVGDHHHHLVDARLLHRCFRPFCRRLLLVFLRITLVASPLGLRVLRGRAFLAWLELENGVALGDAADGVLVRAVSRLLDGLVVVFVRRDVFSLGGTRRPLAFAYSNHSAGLLVLRRTVAHVVVFRRALSQLANRLLLLHLVVVVVVVLVRNYYISPVVFFFFFAIALDVSLFSSLVTIGILSLALEAIEVGA